MTKAQKKATADTRIHKSETHTGLTRYELYLIGGPDYPAGVLYALFGEASAQLNYVFVVDQVRRCHLATQLLNALVRDCIQKRIDVIYTQRVSAKARIFAQKNGFEQDSDTGEWQKQIKVPF